MINARKAEISSSYLSEDERVAIAGLQRRGHTVRAIAAELDRSPSTVSRELRASDPPRPLTEPCPGIEAETVAAKLSGR